LQAVYNGYCFFYNFTPLKIEGQMFFGLLPITDVLLFIGMTASWLYLSIGIISLRPVNTEDVYNHLSFDQKQNTIVLANDKPQGDFHVNYHCFSKIHQADVPKVVEFSGFSPVCVSIFIELVDPYFYLKGKPSPGRAPPTLSSF
jgi:hypothetical protein